MSEPIVWEEREFKRQDSTKVRQERNIYRKHFRSQFIEGLYASGELAALGQGRKGGRHGKLPQTYNVHHKTPLSCGGKSDFDNLCVIDVEIHDLLNKVVLDPQTLNGPREGVFIVPALKNVTTKKNSRELYERLLDEKQKIR